MENLKEKIREYWTRSVPGFSEAAAKFDSGSREFFQLIDSRRYKNEPYVVKLLSDISRRRGKVLEIGFGMGADLRYLATRKVNIVGMDLSFSNAFRTAQSLSLLELPGIVLNADAENLPFKNCSFDQIYSYGVLHHTPDTEKALSEIKRVLTQNGCFTIMLYHRGLAFQWIRIQYFLNKLRGIKTTLGELITRNYDHTPLSRMYSVSQLRDIFKDFEDIRIEIVTYGGIRNNKKFFWLYYLLNACPFLMRKLGSFAVITGMKR